MTPWLGLIATLYAPLTEEAAKWLTALVPAVRRAISAQPVAVALAVGIGFGIGEIWFLAQAIVSQPNFTDAPFWRFNGFIIERLEVCFLHGAFVSLPFVQLARGRPFWIGGVAGMALHFLLNFPIYLAQIDVPPLGRERWGILLALWVPGFVIACVRMESEGSTHRVYFNGVLLINFNEARYTTGQPGIAAAIFGGPTMKILTFTGGSIAQSDQTPPVRSNGQPTGVLQQGTSQTTLGLEHRRERLLPLCHHSGRRLRLMPNLFSDTGSVATRLGERTGRRQRLQLLRALSGRQRQCQCRRLCDPFLRGRRAGSEQQLPGRRESAPRGRDVGHARLLGWAAQKRRGLCGGYAGRSAAGTACAGSR